MAVIVLRLGHRILRDKRISTHCGLAARALGADGIIYSGEQDDEIVKSVSKVAHKWGGNFSVRYSPNFFGEIRKFKREGGMVAHLTMYGLPFEKVILKIRKKLLVAKKAKPAGKEGKEKFGEHFGDLLVVVGAEKVPIEVYKLADYNVGVTNQPHSEVAALAVFLYALFSGKGKFFPQAIVKITPVARGKRVTRAHE